MDEKVCIVCDLAVTDCYVLTRGGYYHIVCFVNNLRTEGTETGLTATLLEILIIHGF